VTDRPGGVEPDWVPVLRDFARASGHELRNALNGLVVNLEVVRTRSAKLDDAERAFLAQAIREADQVSRLAEGTIALLSMLVAAIDDTGSLTVKLAGPRSVEIDAGSEAERVVRNLATLVERTSLTADVSGGTVILSIPERTPDSS
jgi:signal transduction histidine kinase